VRGLSGNERIKVEFIAVRQWLIYYMRYSNSKGNILPLAGLSDDL